MKVLVTGANGFVGGALMARLASDTGHRRRAAVRKVSRETVSGDLVGVGDIDGRTDWSEALAGIEVVVHTAARVHVMRDSEDDSLAAYRRVNLHGSLNLARQAVDAGARRFVFISTIKVNGERTVPGKPFTAVDDPNPHDPYGISKFEAEQALSTLGRDSGLEVVIVRPPLVYGPGVRANFRNLLHLVWRGLPLPLASTRNKRSFVALDNLVDLVTICIDSPQAADQVFLVSDAHDLSTAELLRCMGNALGKPARLLPVPISLMRGGARLLGKSAIAQRLFDSLQVDIGETRTRLDWSPPVSVAEAMQKTADHFIANLGRK